MSCLNLPSFNQAPSPGTWFCQVLSGRVTPKQSYFCFLSWNFYMSMVLNFLLIMYMNDSFLNLLKFINFLLGIADLRCKGSTSVIAVSVSKMGDAVLATSTSYFSCLYLQNCISSFDPIISKWLRLTQALPRERNPCCWQSLNYKCLHIWPYTWLFWNWTMKQ